MRYLLMLALSTGTPALWAQGTGIGERDRTQPPAPPTSPNTNNNSINSNAKTGQASQQIGQIMNGVAGSMFMVDCIKGPNYASCAMAAMSFASMFMMGKAAGQSGNTEFSSRNDGGGGGGDTTPPPGSDTPPPEVPWAGLPDDKVPPDVKEDFKKLLKDGWTITKDGVVTPDGKKLTSDDFKSPESMVAAGFSAGQASSALGTLAKINAALAEKAGDYGANDPHLVGVSYDGSGGGAGGGGRSPASDGISDYLKRLRNPFGLNGAQKSAMVAGKSIAHGEDRVGVKFDNIFEMVNRAYQGQRDGDQFNEPKLTATAVKPVINVKKTRNP